MSGKEEERGASLNKAEREKAWLDSQNDRILKEIQAIVRGG